MDWYYVSAGDRAGPVGDEELAELATAGTIHGDTLVWCDGMTDWAPYADVAAAPGGVDTLTRAPAHRVCAECGGHAAPEASVAFAGSTVCAACKPVFFARVAEGSLQSTKLEYAGFWPRAGAKIVDNCLIGMFNMAVVGGVIGLLPDTGNLVMLAFNVLNVLVSITAALAYGTYFIGRFGATPGKMILGLEVVRPDGRRITYPRALGRAFFDFLTAAMLYIGYLLVLFDEEKRALHDFVCDTRVIRV